MVTLFKRPGAEEGLDARIAGLRRARGEPDVPEKAAPPPPPQDNTAAPVAPAAPVLPEAPPAATPGTPATAPLPPAAPSSLQEHLAVAREELVARLSAEIRPERRALLSRSDLAKLVSGAVQAYFVRHAIEANPLARRDLVTDIMQALITTPEPAASVDGSGVRQLPGRRAAVEAAKAQIQPLVLEHMDVAAAAEMPQLAGRIRRFGYVQLLVGALILLAMVTARFS